jgi:hypothetical protein
MLRRKDSLGDKLWRYRGVAVVLTIPVMVITMFMMLIPRFAHRALQLGTSTDSLLWPSFRVCRMRAMHA